MMSLWNESEVMEVSGKLYLNSVATKRFLNAYSDRLKLAPDVNYDDILIGYDYATKVVAKYPVKSSNYSLQDFLGNNMTPVMDYKSSDASTYNPSEKQLPVLVQQKDFININTPELQYTDDELKVINYFKKEGKVNLNKIPQILKGQGFSPDRLVEYGYLLSRALPWYEFTSSDEQELRDKAIRARILSHDLPSIIKNSRDLTDVIAVLKAYKKYGNDTCSEQDLIDAINDFLINVIDETEIKNFWDALSNDEVYEGLYLKAYFGKLYPFKQFQDNEIVDVEIINTPLNSSEVLTDEDLISILGLNHQDGSKDSESSVMDDDIDIVSSSEIDDVILLDDDDNFDNKSISRSDINEAFEQFKDELANSNDDEIYEQIEKCINFGNPYHELLKIYQNSDSSRWSTYDDFVSEVIKDKVDYSLEIDSKDAYQSHVRTIGLIISDIQKLSVILKTDTFNFLSIRLGLTEAELDDLACKYSVGIGDPIHDFGLKMDEANKEDNNDSFTIKRRRKPKNKTEIKKYIYAALAGAGIISCLYLTIVLERNPINVIRNCVSTFKALFKGNSTLAALGASMGNLTTYFGSAIVAIGSGLKLGKMIEQDDDNEVIKQGDSTDSNSSFEEIEPFEPFDIDLDDIVVDEQSTGTVNDEVDSSIDDAIEISDEEFDEFIELDNTDVKRR